MIQNKGYFIQLIDRTSSRVLFSASTGTFDETDFNTLWSLVGKTVLQTLKKEEKKPEGYTIHFTIETTLLP